MSQYTTTYYSASYLILRSSVLPDDGSRLECLLLILLFCIAQATVKQEKEILKPCGLEWVRNCYYLKLAFSCNEQTHLQILWH